MYRSCRAGRSAWRQLGVASGLRRPLQRATATTATTVTTAQGQATTTTTTIITTTTTTVTTQTRPFASGACNNGQEASGADVEARTEARIGQDAADVAAPPSPPASGDIPTESDGKPAAGNKAGAETDNSSLGDGPKIIFSGIQPTGVPHLGNYLGALREWKRLQDTAHEDTKLFFSIVDLHALTVPRPREEMHDNRYQMLACLLAIGLDPERSTIFFQSMVPAHSELQWILSCTASTGYLSRMTQWKSKMHLAYDASLDDPKARKSLKHGLFSYPILQAADILAYGTTHVPVGEDQRQHLEFARECATNFNSTYKTRCFVSPRTLLSPTRRIMSLSNPLQKMSKSDPSPKSCIFITDSPEEITKKLKHAVTDDINSVTYEPATRPGVANLIEILSSFDPQGRTPAQLGEQMQGYKIADLKQAVAQVVADHLAEFRERYRHFMSDNRKMRAIAAQGASKARSQSHKAVERAKLAIGMGAYTPC